MLPRAPPDAKEGGQMTALPKDNLLADELQAYRRATLRYAVTGAAPEHPPEPRPFLLGSRGLGIGDGSRLGSLGNGLLLKPVGATVATRHDAQHHRRNKRYDDERHKRGEHIDKHRQSPLHKQPAGDAGDARESKRHQRGGDKRDGQATQNAGH